MIIEIRQYLQSSCQLLISQLVVSSNYLVVTLTKANNPTPILCIYITQGSQPTDSPKLTLRTQFWCKGHLTTPRNYPQLQLPIPWFQL